MGVPCNTDDESNGACVLVDLSKGQDQNAHNIQELVHSCFPRALMDKKGSTLVFTGAGSPIEQLQVVSYLFWVLKNFCKDSKYKIELHSAAGLVISKVEFQPNVISFISAITFQGHLTNSRPNQILDCRARELVHELSAHLEGSKCWTKIKNVPSESLLQQGKVTFLPAHELQFLFERMGVDLQEPIDVLSESPENSAVAATALVLAGHREVAICDFPSSDYDFVSFLNELANLLDKREEILEASVDGIYDVSPLIPESSLTEADGNRRSCVKAFQSAVKEGISDSVSKEKQEEEHDSSSQQYVLEEEGSSFFDMPLPVAREDFLSISREIYRLVTFVLAPLGFPSWLRDSLSLSQMQTQCGPLFQDVIEVCSDLIYERNGLSEGVMATAVHKWVEEKRDGECGERVKAINQVLETLYSPPQVVQVPALDESECLRLFSLLREQVTSALRRRAPWALQDVSDLVSTDKISRGWSSSMYPMTAYSLGFLPVFQKRRKLSTLQLKSLILATAEAIWDVVETQDVDLVQLEALWQAIPEQKRCQVQLSEQNLYVMAHVVQQESLIEEVSESSAREQMYAIEAAGRHFRGSRFDLAAKSYSDALKLAPPFHFSAEIPLAGRARCRVKLGDLRQARREAECALYINPFSCTAYRCLGEIEELEGRAELSMQHYVTAFVLDGSRSPDYAECIDRVSREVGRAAAKGRFSEMVMKHDLPAQWLVESYFDSFEHDADFTIALPSSVGKSPNLDEAASMLTPEALLHRAIYYKRKREYRRASEDLHALVAAPERLPQSIAFVAFNLHASFLYVAGYVISALELIERSLDCEPEHVNSLVKKGGFLCELGRFEEAEACFEQAMELDPCDADVYLHWGQMELINGDYQNAVQHLRRCISRSEVLAVTHVSYGMALYKSGSIYQAIDVFRDAVRRFPASAEVRLFYGELLSDQGNYAEAMRQFYRAFDLAPRCPLPFLNAGRVYLGTNDPVKAIAHFQRALKVDPRCSSAHLDIAQILFAQGSTDEAFEHFEVAARCCRFLPEVEEACSSMAMAKMQLRVTEILGVELRHILKVR